MRSLYLTLLLSTSIIFMRGPLSCLPVQVELSIIVCRFDHCLGQSDCSFLLASVIGPEVVTHLKRDQSQPFRKIFYPAAARDGTI